MRVLHDFGDVVVLERVLKTQWGNNMCAVRLPGGALLLHSPTFDGDETFTQVESFGRPTILFAPNHFHHLSLPKYRARYPQARVIASDRAQVRLGRKGHRGLAGLDEGTLPAGARFLTCDALKNGEAWLALPGERGPTWIVCDAFCNVTRRTTGMMGVLVRALKITPGLCIGNTFRWAAVADLRVYREWLTERLRIDRPYRLIISHGDPVEGPDLADRLLELAHTRLT